MQKKNKRNNNKISVKKILSIYWLNQINIFASVGYVTKFK